MKLLVGFRKTTFLITWLIFVGGVQMIFANAPKFNAQENVLLKKNFYLLYLLEKVNPSAMDQVLQQISTARNLRLTAAVDTCSSNACLVNALQLNPLEITQIGGALVSYATKNPAFLNELRFSKTNVNLDGQNDANFLKRSWELSAIAMNKILAVYVNGEKPAYPKIDAGDYAPNDAVYVKKMKKLWQQLAVKEAQENRLPYRNLLLASLKILLLNHRDEAIRYEPLEKGWNKSAVKQLAKTDWHKYPYSVILVPGLGPEEEGVRLDPNGAKRCDSAAKRYFAGLAPFIVVSGGHVHPNKTPFAEAVEMKKYLMKVWKVPANAILIEPHARHTTTNLRNMNRMIYRFKMPTAKNVLIVTDVSQSTYILGTMGKNASRDLGYVPYAAIKKISDTETSYLPNELSLQSNPIDPLDPR